MAIFYNLYIDTEAAPASIHELVAARIECEADPEVPERYIASAGSGLYIVTGPVDDQSRQWMLEDWGFEPRVDVDFRLDKFDLETARDSLARCLAGVIQGEGDLLLVYYGELPVMERRAGDLVFREDYGLWTPERLSLIESPYRLSDLGPVR